MSDAQVAANMGLPVEDVQTAVVQLAVPLPMIGLYIAILSDSVTFLPLSDDQTACLRWHLTCLETMRNGMRNGMEVVVDAEGDPQ